MSVLGNNTFLDWISNSFGAKQQWNSSWETYLASDPELKNVKMCLDLVFGSSRRVFVSTDLINTTSTITGRIYKYLPFMETSPEISAEYQIGTGPASQRSFSMTVSGLSVGDPMDLLNNDYMLSGFVEISLQYDGGDYDHRIVIMRGEMDSPSFGNKDEYIEFDVLDLDKTFSKIIPEHYVTKEKFPSCGDDVIGSRYPLIFDRHFAVPCIRLEQGEFGPRFMVCQTHDFEVIQVFVDGIPYADQLSAYPHTIEYSTDQNGINYMAINFSYVASNPEFASGTSVYAKIRKKSGEYRGIIDVMKNILTDYSQFGVKELDEVLFAKSSGKIGMIELQTLINGSDSDNATRATQFIEETICNQLPMISMVYTHRGYGPVITDRQAEPVGTYKAHSYPFIGRKTGLREVSKKDLFSSFTIRYAYNPMTDTYEKILTLDETNSESCRKSKFQIGVREHDVIESVYIYSDETALAVLSWLSEHKTRPCYYVEYEGFPILYFRLDLGDNIIFSDDKLGLSGYTCTITKKTLTESTCILGLKVWT